MAGPMSVFREIHRLRSFAHTLQEQLDRIPRQLKIHQTKLAKYEQSLREAQDAIRKGKVTGSDKEKQLKGKHDQIERYEVQVNQISSKKEYDALQLEIAHARTVCAQLEEEILLEMTDVDERTARLPDLEKSVARARAELATYEAESAGRRADLEAQLVQARKDLEAAEVHVPAELRPQYNRTVSSLGHDGFALVKDRTCTSCYTEPTRTAHVSLEHEEFVVCNSCGRILYLPVTHKSGDEDD